MDAPKTQALKICLFWSGHDDFGQSNGTTAQHGTEHQFLAWICDLLKRLKPITAVLDCLPIQVAAYDHQLQQRVSRSHVCLGLR